MRAMRFGMGMRSLALALGMLATFAPRLAPASAAESVPFASPRDTVSLIAETDSYAPGAPLRLGLRFRLAPGWHIYWKNPGAAGAPPTLALSPGATGSLVWPAPERITEGPVTVFGYTGEVVLATRLTPPAGQNGPLAITAQATWLVCAKLCVPEEAHFRLTLPPGEPKPSAQAPLFAAAELRAPQMRQWPAVITPEGRLVITPETKNGDEQARRLAGRPYFFPERPGLIDPDASETQIKGNGRVFLALATLPAFDANADLAGVVEFDGDPARAIAITAHPGAVPLPATAALPLWQSVIFGLLGGLILNFMPCVFPVLAMKAIGLAQFGYARRRAVIAHALAYAAGVLATFVFLGGVLIVLRASGAAAGWGFQFQSPASVTAMAWLLFGVGLNLSGVFSLGGGVTGLGQSFAGRHGLIGSFFTGLLAVLVATPCTAPFMGAALAAAMVAKPAAALGVFLAMGMGLAAPYLLLALLPGLGRVMPRPGRWMEWLRQGLAFPMYGATAWLAWVVSREAGSAGVLGLSAGLVLLGFAGWALGVGQQAPLPRLRRIAQSAVLTAVLAALAILSGLASAALPEAPMMAANDVGGGGAMPYSAGKLAALRAEGRPVLVNMTAAWCVTCLVNERMALDTAEIRRALADRDVAYMVGDWTRQDTEITAFLHQFDRDGVPLYVFYPGGDRPPIVLPPILTETGVLAALEAVHQKSALAAGSAAGNP